MLRQSSANLVLDRKRKLVPCTCSFKSYLVPNGLSVKHLQKLESVAEAYRYAGYIYLISTLARGIREGSVDSEPNDNVPEYTNLGLPYTIEDAIEKCFNAIEQISDGDGCESALVLPLFLVGCETDRPGQIAAVVKRLMMMERSIGIGNIKRARKVVQKVWCSVVEPGGKKPWQYVLQELGWDLILT
jgi:hypothetical protein